MTIINDGDRRTAFAIRNEYDFCCDGIYYEKDEFNGRCYYLDDSTCLRADCDGKMVRRRISNKEYNNRLEQAKQEIYDYENALGQYEYLKSYKHQEEPVKQEIIKTEPIQEEKTMATQNYTLIKSEHFGNVTADIYSNGDEMFMTAKQLYECLDETKGTFDSRLSRNPKLKTSEFSVTCKLQATDGKMYNTRIFNEDGIYEITMLSESKKGDEFRSWIRKVLKSLRKGETTLIKTCELQEIEVKAKLERATAMRMNAENRRLKLLLSNPNWKGLSDVALQTMGIKAVETVTGQNLGNMLLQCEKTYSATEVCKMFGNVTNPCTLGKKAKANGLQSEEYGIWVMDKSRYSSKEVKSFRYNEKGIHALAVLLGVAGYKIA